MAGPSSGHAACDTSVWHARLVACDTSIWQARLVATLLVDTSVWQAPIQALAIFAIQSIFNSQLSTMWSHLIYTVAKLNKTIYLIVVVPLC